MSKALTNMIDYENMLRESKSEFERFLQEQAEANVQAQLKELEQVNKLMRSKRIVRAYEDIEQYSTEYGQFSLWGYNYANSTQFYMKVSQDFQVIRAEEQA